MPAPRAILAAAVEIRSRHRHRRPHRDPLLHLASPASREEHDPAVTLRPQHINVRGAAPGFSHTPITKIGVSAGLMARIAYVSAKAGSTSSSRTSPSRPPTRARRTPRARGQGPLAWQDHRGEVEDAARPHHSTADPATSLRFVIQPVSRIGPQAPCPRSTSPNQRCIGMDRHRRTRSASVTGRSLHRYPLLLPLLLFSSLLFLPLLLYFLLFPLSLLLLLREPENTGDPPPRSHQPVSPPSSLLLLSSSPPSTPTTSTLATLQLFFFFFFHGVHRARRRQRRPCSRPAPRRPAPASWFYHGPIRGCSTANRRIASSRVSSRLQNAKRTK